MINKDYVCKLGLEFIDEYWFDNTHHSFVFKHNNICVIVDDNICENKEPIVFNYSKYCEIAKANISEDNKRDEEVIKILNKVKENILKKRFKEELVDKEYENYLIKEIKECEQLLEQEDEDDYYNQSVEARKVALCDALREYRIKDYYEKKE